MRNRGRSKIHSIPEMPIQPTPRAFVSESDHELILIPVRSDFINPSNVKSLLLTKN
jgi:hypothetical protein